MSSSNKIEYSSCKTTEDFIMFMNQYNILYSYQAKQFLDEHKEIPFVVTNYMGCKPARYVSDDFVAVITTSDNKQYIIRTFLKSEGFYLFESQDHYECFLGENICDLDGYDNSPKFFNYSNFKP